MKNTYLLLSIILFISPWGIAQETKDLKTLRDEQIKKWGTDEVPQVRAVIDEAKSYLALPIEQQSIEGLGEIAEKTNRASNFVGYILNEYQEYYRDNYKYSFVQEKVAPFHDEYVVIANELRHSRNLAFFYLGILYKKAGDNITAFFYFKDSFTLSSFTEEGGVKGLRYKAEIEMKQILGIEDVGTFLHWNDK